MLRALDQFAARIARTHQAQATARDFHRAREVACALEPDDVVLDGGEAGRQLFDPLAPIGLDEPPAAARQHEHHGNQQRQLQATSRTFGTQPILSSRELGFMRTRLEARQVRVHRRRQFLGIPRSRRARGHQRREAEADQVLRRVAGFDARARVVELRERRHLDEVLPLLRDVRRRAGQDLAQERAEREDVGALIELVRFALGLFGRHVRGRAEDAADHGARVRARATAHRFDHAHRGVARLDLVGDAASTQDLGQSPVDDLHLAERSNHDVGGLQVAVNDALRVGVGHRLANGLPDLEEAHAILLDRLAPREHRRERPPLDQLHREERTLIGHQPQLVDRHDARVLQLAADLRFFDESLEDFGALGELGVGDLDRDVATELDVVPAQHDAHAAARDLTQNAVLALVRGRQLLLKLVRLRIDDRRFAPGASVVQVHALGTACATRDRVEDRIPRTEVGPAARVVWVDLGHRVLGRLGGNGGRDESASTGFERGPS